MSEPFISRRCQNCGASIRKSGSFCPQCGTRAAGSSAVPGSQELSTSAGKETKANVTKKLREPSPQKTDSDGKPGSIFNESVHYSSSTRSARVGEVLGSRVERIKHRSHAMIDEATVDPSFRFILVTAVLFVLFILLLFFSHVLR